MKYYVVNAFVTEAAFSGNPAGVLVLDEFFADGTLQAIAAQNNLSETAFAVRVGQGRYKLRWFTPKNEVDLCGHATLAASYVIMEHVDKGLSEIRFDTMSGELVVRRSSKVSGSMFVLDFPSRKPVPVPVTKEMREAVGADVLEAYASRDLMLVLPSAKEVAELKPDMRLLEELPEYLGVIVTTKGTEEHGNCDFISRFFAPKEGIPEDPVTGSAHCNLIPFWAERLGKTEMTARQLSERGGLLFVKNLGDRVEIAGRAALYLEGEIRI